MSKKKKQEETGTAKPFFARYLEGQDPETSSAKVGGGRSLSYKKVAPAGPVTLKAPSDKDELIYVPYYLTKVDIPEKYKDVKQTLKYPSDSDEQIYDAVYIAKTYVPKTAVAAAKEGTLKLKKQSSARKRR